MLKLNDTFKSSTPISFIELGIIGAIIYLLSIRILLIFSYSTDLEGLEYISAHFIQLITTQRPLYSNPSEFPFLLSVYTPLYHYIIAGCSSLLSIDVLNDTHQLFIFTRILSLMLLFLDFFILIKIIALFIPDFKPHPIFLLLFLLLLPKHFFTCRPDSFKVTCFLLFLLFNIKYTLTHSYKYYAWGFIFLFLGILFKQDLIIYGLAYYGILLLLTRRYIYLAAPILLISITITGVYLTYLNTGENILQNLLVYNLQYNTGLHLSFLIITVNIIRLAPLIYFTFINLKSEEKATYRIAVVSSVYFILSSLSILRVGSNINYTYESFILLLINFLLYQKEHQHRMINKALITYAIFLFLFLGKLNLYSYSYNTNYEITLKKEYHTNHESFKEIKKIIKNDVVFFPNMKYTIYYPQGNLIYGYDWHYDRFTSIYLNLDLKKLNYHPTMESKFIVNDMIRKYDQCFSDGTVKFLVINNDVNSLSQINKYYQKYKMTTKVNNFLVYQYHP